MKIIEQLLSIKNEDMYKVIRLLGMKIKFRRRKSTLPIQGKNIRVYTPFQITETDIGEGTYIAQGSMISMATIGKYCSIGPHFVCGYGIHPIDGLSTSPAFYSTRMQNGMTFSDTDKIIERKRITIGNDVFIGMNVTILDGVTVGNGAIIGAGAVVISDVAPYSIVGGVPAKHIKYRFDEETIKALQEIQWWNFDDEKIKDVERYFFNIQSFIAKYRWGGGQEIIITENVIICKVYLFCSLATLFIRRVQ